MTSYTSVHDGSRPEGRGLSNETFGVFLFIIAESMFFAGLASAYVVLRNGAAQWKPAHLPPLAGGLSLANTALLCLSGLSTGLAHWFAARREGGTARLFLWVTLAAGLTFVGVQAYEFRRLLEIVPWSGNIFGSVFYTYSGLHAVHVLGGLAWLVNVLVKGTLAGAGWKGRTPVLLFSLYWYFVILVWIFLFLALYVW